MPHKQNWIALACWLGCASVGLDAAPARNEQTSADLFRLTNIWNVHLRVSSEGWAAMEPKGGGSFFGGPRGPGGGPPRPFGPSMFLAPAFLRDGDADADGKFTKAEFMALGEKWFSRWDKEGGGKVNNDQLRDGLNAVLMPPGQGGGPGFRMNLQGPEGKRNGVASAAGIEFESVKADLKFEDRQFTNVSLRYKGNGTFMASQATDKRSLKVDLNDFVKGQKLAGLTKLNLHNNVTDASWMNEVLSHKLFRDAGVPAPRTAYAKVYVTVPGKFEQKYLGLYSLVENVDADFAKANFDTKKGAIFKPVTPDLFAYLGDDWAKYSQTYDPKGDVQATQKTRIIDLCRLVSKATDEEFDAKIGDYIDLEEFSRYMAVLVFLADLDGILGPGQNFYLHMHPQTRKLAFIPWDLDHSFGQFGLRGTQEQRENLSIRKPWQGQNKFLERMFKHAPFSELYRARLDEFRKGLFDPTRFHQQVDELAGVIRSAVEAESEGKLARFDAAVSGKSVEPGSFGRGPGAPRMGGFMQPSKPIRPFVKIRAQSIADQLAGNAPGHTLGEFGFGPPGGGAPPRGFGPGMFLAGAFMPALDSDKDGQITKDEASRSFSKWFEAWKKTEALSDEDLRAGIDRDLAPQFGGPGGFRPPGPPQ
jgi:spore coat protein H